MTTIISHDIPYIYIKINFGDKLNLFVGKHENKLDTKGRVSLPSSFRDQLHTDGDAGCSFYIFPSPNSNCIEGGSKDLIESIAQKIEENSVMFSEDEDILMYVISNARLISCDSTGRFKLPNDLIETYGYDEKIAFIGRARRFQIWNTEKYKQVEIETHSKIKQNGYRLPSHNGGEK